MRVHEKELAVSHLFCTGKKYILKKEGSLSVLRTKDVERKKGERKSMARYRCIQRLGLSGQTTLEGTLESIKKYPGAWDAVAWFTPADFNDTEEEQLKKIAAFAPRVEAA